MKVLYICNYPLSGDQSPSINERGFCEALAKEKSLDVDYFIEAGDVDIALNKKRVNFFKSYPMSRPIHFIFSSFRSALRVCRMLKKAKKELVVVRPNRAPLKEILIALYCRFSGKKIVIKNSEKYWIDGKPINRLDHILCAVDLLLYRVLHNLSSGIECITAMYRDLHLKRGIRNDKLAVIGNAVGMDKFNLSQSKRTDYKDFYPVLGYCGSFPEERGAYEIYHLVQKMKKDFPNILGVIVGEDDGLGELKKKAIEDRLENNFKCIGRVPFSEVPSYLRTFDVSFSYTHEKDIVGGDSSMKVRQSIACGTPVITFPLTNGWISENGLGRLADIGDYDAIERQTRKLLKDVADGGMEYQKHLHAYIKENLSHEVMLEKRMEFWQRILNQGSS